jgi:tight adherence protein C
MKFDPAKFDLVSIQHFLTTPDGIACAVFVAIALILFVLLQVFRMLTRNPLQEQIDAITGRGNAPLGSDRASLVTQALAAQIPQTQSDLDALDLDLRRAGQYGPYARSEFLALRNGLVFGALIATGAVAVMIGPAHQDKALKAIIGGLGVTVLAWAIPRILLKMQGKRRAARIQEGLPDALDLISMCLTGGLSLHDTFLHVCKEIVFVHPDLAVELLIIRQQSEMTSLEEAFKHFARRLDSPEVVSLTTIIAQSQRLGVNMVDSIRDYADGIRLKRRQMADEFASKANMRLLFPLVLCLMPATCILLWGPAALQLRNFLATFTVPKL